MSSHRNYLKAGCINCEDYDGTYETEYVGPFCEECWNHLKNAFLDVVVDDEPHPATCICDACYDKFHRGLKK